MKNSPTSEKDPNSSATDMSYLHITRSNCTLMACTILMSNSPLKSKKLNFSLFTIKPNSNQVIE